jgi:hypothetical protein
MFAVRELVTDAREAHLARGACERTMKRVQRGDVLCGCHRRAIR